MPLHIIYIILHYESYINRGSENNHILFTKERYKLKK